LAANEKILDATIDHTFIKTQDVRRARSIVFITSLGCGKSNQVALSGGQNMEIAYRYLEPRGKEKTL